MKVLHILGSNSFSGAENVACQIINMTKGFAESIYVSRNGIIRNALESRKIKYIMLDKLSVLELKRVVKRERPDVVHAHDMKASLIASIAVDRGTRFVSHIHNNNFKSRKFTVKSILYAFAAGRADYIVWVSRSSKEGYFFSKLFIDKSLVLYNVIDTLKIREKLAEDNNKYPYDILYVGRLAYQKNPQFFVEIIAELKKRFQNVQAAMLGEGEYYSEISALIKSNGLEDNVSLLGFVDNPYKIMSDSKIMVITSEWEGTPMCALEAMFLGLPIVSTPVDGMRDLIVESENGFFAESLGGFVERIEQLIDDSDMYGKMSEDAVKRFNMINSYQRYEDKIRVLYTEQKVRSITK